MGEEIINTPKDIAETFNSHFASVGEKLAFDILPSAVKPEVYVEPAQTIFSMRSPTVNAAFKKLKAINERIGKQLVLIKYLASFSQLQQKSLLHR